MPTTMEIPAKPATIPKAGGISEKLIRTNYTSFPVSLPDTFLAPLPDPSTTIKVTRINFAASPLPEYTGLYAVILDNVLSPEECDQLLHMVEMSAGAHQNGDSPNPPPNNGWIPALINAGHGYESLKSDVRDSDRIIWDHRDLVDRLWRRVMQVEALRDELMTVGGTKYADVIEDDDEVRWVAKGLNERMRFLRYSVGQHFRPHCDGTTRFTTPDGGIQQTHYTFHLYLKDSVQALDIAELSKRAEAKQQPCSAGGHQVKPEQLLRGGATTFHSRDLQRRLDVDPKAGRVLIFQHARLFHSGDHVRAGVKYTMRTEIVYEMERTGADANGEDDDSKESAKQFDDADNMLDLAFSHQMDDL